MIEFDCFLKLSGYLQSAMLLAHNFIATIVAFQWKYKLPLKQANPHHLCFCSIEVGTSLMRLNFILVQSA